MIKTAKVMLAALCMLVCAAPAIAGWDANLDKARHEKKQICFRW